MTIVADPPEMLDDRPELEVALARQNAVAVARQLARSAAQITELHPRQIARIELRQILGLARTCVIVEDVQANTGALGARLLDQGDRRLEAGTEGRRLLKLECESDPETRSQLGRFSEGFGGTNIVLGARLRHIVRSDD